MPHLSPRKRTRQDELVYREVANPDDEEYRRKWQNTANSVWNIFRAMLNFGYRQGEVANRAAWDKVQSFHAVSEPRIVKISFAELAAVIDACDPVFLPLAKAALYTGARYSELCRMKVKDFNPETSKVFLPKTKTFNSRYVLLNDEALELFVQLTAHRNPDDAIFLKNGNPWSDNHQTSFIHRAVDAAGVTRNFTFHQFRHKCACICLENGMRMEEVSYMLGHRSVAVTEKYYANFSADYMQDKVNRFAPRLHPVAPQSGPDDTSKVIPFRKTASGL